VKFSERWSWEELRHRLVLTPEEKRVVSFVVIALLLGLGTKCYRDAHPQFAGKKPPTSGEAHR